MDSEQANKIRWWHAADRVGATASFLCAIHCALLPFVIALLPLLGLEFLADHRFERVFVLFACVLASFVLVRGYRRHQRTLPLRLAAPGLALLLLGIIYIDGSTPVLHSVLVTFGGLLLAAAHFVNLRLDSRSNGAHVHGPQCAH
ncbi:MULTISPECIES: MerC domain-containing protein [Rhodanobacter]|uniref:MerC domain-containing protein n=1 Tax=Rhodanobacter TaxID=75309 RepID=UPI0004257645|nr:MULTISPECIES: MerC domain-containing protein [Rhodanobacter]TAN18619.1 MAG: MerC domain-containing protein [Rhodanobacter sp.]UJJ56381.1 MerC domain-containing protein [Rhodanobacter thiooxydans]